MANMGQLVRRQSSRELRHQKSYDRMELRELHGRLLHSDASASHSVNYGSLNPAFKEDTTTELVCNLDFNVTK
jgi:solute carrier family 6 amino acid/orphan transporter-like 15/16/17/18/20